MNNHKIIKDWITDFEQKHNRQPSHIEITEKMLTTFDWTTGMDARHYRFEASFRSRISDLRKHGKNIISKAMPISTSDGRRSRVHGHRIEVSS